MSATFPGQGALNTVAARLARRVAASPDAVAFQYEGAPGEWVPVTWADFGQRVENLRRGLVVAGLRAGDRLALIAPVGLEWELLHHAALALGVVVVGLDAHDLPERIAGMVELADITAFATASPKVLAQLPAARWARCRLALQLGEQAETWHPDAAVLAWADLVAMGRHSDMSAFDGPAPDDMATVIFTSGTTGAPKGIAYQHSQLCLAIDAIADAFPFVGPGSRLLCWLPLSNLFQRIVNLAGLERGASSYLLGDPRRVMAVVGGVAPDVFIGVPRFYEKLYEGVRERIGALPFLQRRAVEWAWQVGRRVSPYRQKRQRLPLAINWAWNLAGRFVLRRLRAVMGHRLQCMVTGSAPTPVGLLEEFHALGWLVLEAYGLSENVLPMAINRVDDFRFGTVGRPVPGNRIVIAEDGAIRAQGPGLFQGYLGEGDRSPFAPDGFYTTGDLGEVSEDGYLKITGRTGDFIKTSTGRRIAPAGVEARLRQVSGIDQAVLIGTGRKYVIAICTTSFSPITAQDRQRLAGELSSMANRLDPHERPLGALLLDRPFSMELGEITPNLKLKRLAIEHKHQSAISELYGRIDSLPVAMAGTPVVM